MTIGQPMPAVPGRKAHRFEPILENRSSTMAPGPLRVVAFNAQGGTRFDAIIRCFANEPLRSAAVILLSEMDSGTRSFRTPQSCERVGADAGDELRLCS